MARDFFSSKYRATRTQPDDRFVNEQAFADDDIDGEVEASLQPDASSPSATTGIHQYLWSGPLGGAWGSPSNWTDLSTGATAVDPPGAMDTATIGASPDGAVRVIAGTATVNFVQIAGDTRLGGDFVVHKLSLMGGTAASPVTLFVRGRDKLTVHQMYVNDDHDSFSVSGLGAELSTPTLTFEAPLIGDETSRISNHGVVHVDNLDFQFWGSLAAPILSVDATSILGVGTGSQIERPGSMTVQANGGIDLDDGIELFAPTIVNNGLIFSGGNDPQFGPALLWGNAFFNHGTLTHVSVRAKTLGNSGKITLQGDFLTGAVNNGEIVAALGDDLISGDVTGIGSIQIGTGGHLTTEAVSVGQTIDFTGQGGSLTIGMDSLDASKRYDATIEDFGPNDIINFIGTVTGASDTDGVLTLVNGTNTVATLNIGGTYNGAQFVAVKAGPHLYQISLIEGGDTAKAPLGTEGGVVLGWVGPVAGSWDDPANWRGRDIDDNLFIDSPGWRDSASLGGGPAGGVQIVTGVGAASGVSISGGVLLDGRFATSFLGIYGGFLTPPSTLFIDAGDVVSDTGDASIDPNAGFYVSGIGARLNVAGTVTFASGAGTVEHVSTIRDHGVVRVGGVVFEYQHGDPNVPMLSVDALSVLEVGDEKVGRAGAITVDDGASIDLGAQGSSGNILKAPTILNNGSIISSNVALVPQARGNLLQANDVINNGSLSGVSVEALSMTNKGVIALYGDTLSGLVNDGQIIAGANDDVISGDVTGTGSIEIASQCHLSTQAMSSGQSLAFLADGALSLSSASLDASLTYGATIKDFGAGDAIDFYATITSASYAAGHLTLADNGSLVAILTLGGDYSAATFTATQKTGYTTINVA